MHNEQHRIVKINDPKKIQVHYNTLKGKSSSLQKPYIPPKCPKAPRGASAEQVKRLETQHVLHHKRIRDKQEHALKLIRQIEECESLKSGEGEKQANSNKDTVTSPCSDVV